jgi:hypothetical protein
MTRSNTVRSAAAAAIVTLASVAQAAGDSGTGSMGEMNVTGAQLGMIVAGLAGMGVVLWLLIKFLSRS